MNRMVALFAALAIGTFPQAEVSAAIADYNAGKLAGLEYRYVSANEQQEPVVRFVAVLASREPLLDSTIPEQLPGSNLLRLNLTALRWSVADWSKVFGGPANPYTLNSDQLIVPAGLFIDRLSDQTRSDAYLRLYFGGDQIPKTLSEFLSRSGGIDRKAQRGLEQLHVEGRSGVNVAGNGARLVELLDGTFATAFVTYDTKQVQPGADPLEQLDRNFKADGSEVFVLTPKVSTLGVRGLFPVMALANGQENIVAEAPVDLVVDHSQTGGFTSIRNPASCIGCHGASQPLNVNALRDRLAAGVELLSYDRRKQVEIELKHLASMEAALAAWDHGYAEALAVVNGLDPQQNNAAFRAAVAAYRADVTLDVAAAELCTTADDLRLALGYASAKSILIDNRLAGLAHGIAAPRSSWEQSYLKAVEILKLWKAAQ